MQNQLIKGNICRINQPEYDLGQKLQNKLIEHGQYFHNQSINIDLGQNHQLINYWSLHELGQYSICKIERQTNGQYTCTTDFQQHHLKAEFN